MVYRNKQGNQVRVIMKFEGRYSARKERELLRIADDTVREWADRNIEAEGLVLQGGSRGLQIESRQGDQITFIGMLGNKPKYKPAPKPSGKWFDSADVLDHSQRGILFIKGGM